MIPNGSELFAQSLQYGAMGLLGLSILVFAVYQYFRDKNELADRAADRDLRSKEHEAEMRNRAVLANTFSASMDKTVNQFREEQKETRIVFQEILRKESENCAEQFSELLARHDTMWKSVLDKATRGGKGRAN